MVIYYCMKTKIHALNDISLNQIPPYKPPDRLSKSTNQLSNQLTTLFTQSEIHHGNNIPPDLFIRSCVHHIRSYGSFSPDILERIRSCSDDEKMEIIAEMNGAMKTFIDNMLNDDNVSPRDS